MGPTGYRELKKKGRYHKDGAPVKINDEIKGVILWGRWSVEAYEWFALVKLEDGTEKYFWFSELTAE